MKAMWNQADVVIEGDDALLQGMRFNLFHILQSASRDGKNGMGAKGLSGEGYEGHYFWDTEMYVMPALIYTTQTWQSLFSAIVTGRLTRRETGPGFWGMRRARCIPGVLSMVRKPPLISRWGRRSTTLMRILPTPLGCISM